MVSPKVSEVTVASTEVFPLKKDEKILKPTFKPLVEEKKIIPQKTTENSASKKSAETNKKIKREKRNESSDSSDSEEGEMNKFLFFK